jgi:hypothetical protein
MKGLVWILVILAVLGGGFYLFNNYIYQEKQGENTYEPYRATLSGEYLCLPHVDTSGPQTLECAFGLKTDDGIYYALDFNLMSQTIPDLMMGQRISASGVVTPVERLSSDHWRQYPIVGIFSVTDSLIRDGSSFDTSSLTPPICAESSKHYVVMTNTEALSEQAFVLVKHKTSSAQTFTCEYVVAEGDIEFVETGPVGNYRLAGDFLTLDIGTAPYPRGLHVYDLRTGERVYSDAYNQPLDVTDVAIKYWQPIPTPATASNCPQYQELTSQGLGAGLEREVVLTLATLKVSAIGKERCSARQ